ncbi:MAG: hypothetical protein M1829_002536 [Trizodia sp. TS-e1964]|nr:MAG: hypothetical protein M1829_002536 [Trizodia sp. TS-e1964]
MAFRSSFNDLVGGGGGDHAGADRRGSGGGRWDSDRLLRERDRAEGYGRRINLERERYDDILEGFVPPERERSRLDDGGRGGRRFRETVVEDRRFSGGRRDGGRDRFPEGRFRDRRPSSIFLDDDDRASRTSSPPRSLVASPRSRRQSFALANPPPLITRGGGRSRPSMLRRQSSLDTFDRIARPRFEEHEEYRPPTGVMIPLPRIRRSPPPIRRFEERDYEEIRIAEPDRYGDEGYREFRERVRIAPEKGRRRRRRSVVQSIRGSSEFGSDEEIEFERDAPRRGKTRMPRRLIHIQAINQLGWPYEEEGDTIVILRALGKDHIDEVMRLSEEIRIKGNVSTVRTEYRIENTPEQHQQHHAPHPHPGQEVYERRTDIYTAPPPAPIAFQPPPPPAPLPPPPAPQQNQIPPPPPPVQYQAQPIELIQTQTITETRRESSPRGRRRDSSHEKRNSSRSKSRRRRHSSTRSETEFIEIRETSNPIHGPLGALILPDRRKNERDIKAEIRALEAESKALRLQRELGNNGKNHRRRKTSDNYIEVDSIRRERDVAVLKVEKDKKGRLSLVR